jgi:hypothetical protein
MERLGSAWLRQLIPLTGVKQTAMLRRGNANYRPVADVSWVEIPQRNEPMT